MDLGIRPSGKVYVEVEAHFDKDGTLLPWEITWENGQKYPIDRVTGIRQVKSYCQGACYTIVVRGQESRLFFERGLCCDEKNIGRWFVERRAGSADAACKH